MTTTSRCSSLWGLPCSLFEHIHRQSCSILLPPLRTAHHSEQVLTAKAGRLVLSDHQGEKENPAPSAWTSEKALEESDLRSFSSSVSCKGIGVFCLFEVRMNLFFTVCRTEKFLPRGFSPAHAGTLQHKQSSKLMRNLPSPWTPCAGVSDGSLGQQDGHSTAQKLPEEACCA